jgi:glycerate dehydrogenase
VNIVVLDGYTLNPGDLDWSGFRRLGHCIFYNRTEPEDVVPRAKNADGVLTNKTRLDREVISELPRLKYIGVLATGYDVVDVEYALQQGIIVTNVPDYSTRSVAQMVFALLLELTNRVHHHSNTVFQGKWSESPDFCYWDYPIVELYGLTMGIVGFGRIGRAVADLARAFGMRVLVHTRRVPSETPEAIEWCSVERLFRDSDVISLHCPLSSETKGIVNAERVAMMKPTAYLINTSRGQLIDEAVVADALNHGLIAGAALDVLPKEPPDSSCPLLQAKNIYITPHIAWATRSARKRLMDIAISNLEAFLAGKEQNVITTPEAEGEHNRKQQGRS